MLKIKINKSEYKKKKEFMIISIASNIAEFIINEINNFPY